MSPARPLTQTFSNVRLLGTVLVTVQVAASPTPRVTEDAVEEVPPTQTQGPST